MILTVGIVNDAQFSSIDNTLLVPIKRLTVPNYCTRRAPMAPIAGFQCHAIQTRSK